MYTNELLDAYKKAKNYIQDKQVAHDLGLSRQKISAIRNGARYLTESEALFIAEEIGADAETVLVYLAADKAKTHKAQQAWANIAKKYNGLGLRGISIACGGLAMWIGSPTEALAKCALCILC
ncbi:TPA: hypothetical protein I7147_18105 [Vibrio vulnificus]|uniref:DUF3693 domain-containing protein n=1 Tax=Vibrio vulnificus TaxID=672 RepID=UPI0019D462A8|nr:DUF3693 domain-containing protein [Vibrio vulnificus]EHU4800882.1 hypothetical protein [Vibrio vulnificus]EKD7165388.1 hypothetical protein [Vibrio vulnificus]ELG4785626.1 hypothetical protein [Vibrio vulnificus]ELK2255353.1 hypothetical protein [Vibrio vulnificus]ELP8107404.1 hypothetical protein [Vibrio vulnificus]